MNTDEVIEATEATYFVYDASPFTIWVIVASMMLTPYYLLLVYVKSRASINMGVTLASLWLTLGGIMAAVCLYDAIRKWGTFANLIIPAVWIVPSALLCSFRKQILQQPLHPRWLVALQLYRAIGGVFLIERSNGFLPGVFAYPAGLGDIFTAAVALAVLIVCPRHQAVPGKYVYALIFVGILDFVSAFFFGFTSNENNMFQLFFSPNPNELINFPTGMVPLFLVPYAIFFHFLSLLNHWQFNGEFDYDSDRALENAEEAAAFAKSNAAAAAMEQGNSQD